MSTLTLFKGHNTPHIAQSSERIFPLQAGHDEKTSYEVLDLYRNPDAFRNYSKPCSCEAPKFKGNHSLNFLA